MNTGIKATKDGRRLYIQMKSKIINTEVLYFLPNKKGLYYHDGRVFKAIREGRKIFWGEGNETYYRKWEWV